VLGKGENVSVFNAYWDTTFTRKFESCTSRRVMPEELWAKDQPDNKGGVEFCTVVNLCADCSNSGHEDVTCVQPRNVLCYQNVTTNQVTLYIFQCG
jgi:hypothetical protein